MPDFKQDAQKDVADIQQKLHDGGADQAYQLLNQDLQKHKGNPDEYKAYLTAVTGELQNKGVLPQLSVNFLKDHMKDYDLTETKEVTAADMNVMSKISSDPLEKAFLDDLKNPKRYDQLRNEVPGEAQQGITLNDMNKALGDQEAQRQAGIHTEQVTKANNDSAKALTQDGGKLFQMLDTAGHHWYDSNTKADGKIEKNDLEAFMANDGMKAQFSPEQQKAVQHLIDTWDTDEGKRLRGGGDEITKDSLAKAVGAKSYDEAAAQLNKPVDQTKVDDKTQQPAGGGGGSFDKDAATKVFDAFASHPDLGKQVCTVTGDTPPKVYVDKDKLNKVLSDDQAHGGKDLTASERDALTNLQKNYDSIAKDGKVQLSDISKAAFQSGDEFNARMTKDQGDAKQLGADLKTAGLDQMEGDGKFNKDTLGKQLQGMDQNNPNYKALKNVYDNFDKVSSDGKDITKDDVDKYEARLNKAAQPADQQADAQAKQLAADLKTAGLDQMDADGKFNKDTLGKQLQGMDQSNPQYKVLKNIYDNFDKVSSNGTDITKDDVDKYEAKVAGTQPADQQADAQAKQLAADLKTAGLDQMDADGKFNKDTLGKQLQGMDQSNPQYKVLKNIYDNFDKVSSNGTDITKDDVDKYEAKVAGTPDPAAHKQELQKAAEQKAHQAAVTDGTQHSLEGPYQAAERLLGKGASHADVMALTRLLKKSYQDMNNDHTDSLKKLPVGYNWLNDKNFEDIVKHSPALAKRLQDQSKVPDDPAPEQQPQQ